MQCRPELKELVSAKLSQWEPCAADTPVMFLSSPFRVTAVLPHHLCIYRAFPGHQVSLTMWNVPVSYLRYEIASTKAPSEPFLMATTIMGGVTNTQSQTKPFHCSSHIRMECALNELNFTFFQRHHLERDRWRRDPERKL